jgi:hypothetical protein
MSDDNKEQGEKLLQLVQEAIKRDKELREEHNIGEKFRFIRDRLTALLSHVDEGLATIKEDSEIKTHELAEDEVLAYIYLFNAQGLVVASWNKMVSQSVMYEYSVNRPIYMEKSHVEAIIRAKLNKALHGYLTLAIKKSDILPAPAGMEAVKDTIGNPVYKVKEGSLQFKNLVSFTHQEHEYIVNAEGELVRKDQ